MRQLAAVTIMFAFGTGVSDARATGATVGLVPPTPAALHATLGLKPPRDNAVPFVMLDDGLPDAASIANPDVAIPYGGMHVYPAAGLRPAEKFSGMLYPLSERWFSSVESSRSEESLLAPQRYSLAGNVYTALGRGWGFSVGLRHSAYRAAGPGDADYSRETGGLNASLIPALYPDTLSATSYRLGFSYLYDTRNRVGLSYTGGRNDDLYSPLDRPLHDARQFMLTGQHWLTPNWALNYNLYSPESGGGLLQPHGLRLGLRYRF